MTTPNHPTLPCGGRAGDRLHHDDGTPRGTAASTDGRELEWFDRHAKPHHIFWHGWSAGIDAGEARGADPALMHAAVDDGEGHCYLCGQRVRSAALGRIVHGDGYVAARTPAVVLAARALVADWLQSAVDLAPGDGRDDYVLDSIDEIENDAIANTYGDLARALEHKLTHPND